jgi:hypothetical protein
MTGGAAIPPRLASRSARGWARVRGRMARRRGRKVEACILERGLGSGWMLGQEGVGCGAGKAGFLVG